MVVFWVLMRCVAVTMIILCHDGLVILYKEIFCYQIFLLCFYDHTKYVTVYSKRTKCEIFCFHFVLSPVVNIFEMWSFICAALETRAGFVCVSLFFYFPFSLFDLDVIYLLVGSAWMILIQIIQIFIGSLPNIVLVDGSVYFASGNNKAGHFLHFIE